MVQAGDDLGALLQAAMNQAGLKLLDGDIIVVAQKIVSKAEGRLVRLDEITPSQEAIDLAKKLGKDERLVELILQESESIVRTAPGVMIVRHKLGFVCANAGIDQSNISHQDGEHALLLPVDPDESARQIRKVMEKTNDCTAGVIISDSMNRPWRLGTLGYAIGSSGVMVLDDRRGDEDIYGRILKVTMSNRADSIATAATLLMGETNESIPAVLMSGFPIDPSQQTAADCIRPQEMDLFL
jgi:coenzyme F420-0:L-glutamate ligase/coenzyme F420-1:gamma-L-glutamate ligase